MFRALLAFVVLANIPLSAAELKIAVLHPLLGDLARQIGGSQVDVVDLIGPNGDPHHFEPKPDDLGKAQGASLYLVAGMGLESYLPKLKTIIASKATLVEVGATLPMLHVTADHGEHVHEIDPHWWHSIDCFRRATGIVAAALTEASPENAAIFQKNAAFYRQQLDELEHWARHELTKIPRNKRHLATTHAAFNYFCKDFGFTAHSVQGQSHEQMPGPDELATLIAELKKNDVAAIFPEKESNPKILQTLTTDTGIRVGDALIADGTGNLSYIEMYHHNVEAIVKALEK